MQEAYGMPASVAPCIVDDSAVGQPFDHHDMSSRVSFDTFDNTVTATPQSRPSHASPVHRTPSHLPHASPVISPDQQFVPTLAPYGGSDDENDDAGDYDDDGDVSSEAAEDVTLEPVRCVLRYKYTLKYMFARNIDLYLTLPYLRGRQVVTPAQC